MHSALDLFWPGWLFVAWLLFMHITRIAKSARQYQFGNVGNSTPSSSKGIASDLDADPFVRLVKYYLTCPEAQRDVGSVDRMINLGSGCWAETNKRYRHKMFVRCINIVIITVFWLLPELLLRCSRWAWSTHQSDALWIWWTLKMALLILTLAIGCYAASAFQLNATGASFPDSLYQVRFGGFLVENWDVTARAMTRRVHLRTSLWIDKTRYIFVTTWFWIVCVTFR